MGFLGASLSLMARFLPFPFSSAAAFLASTSKVGHSAQQITKRASKGFSWRELFYFCAPLA
jgi:hypothetical protein